MRLNDIFQIKYRYFMHQNIVLHDFNAIYFFIPKVACTSIKKIIADILEIKSPDKNNPEGFIHRREYPYAKTKDIQVKYSHYYKFCFVRNPWDRVVSCYNNKIFNDKMLNDHTIKNGIAKEFIRYRNMFWAGMSFEEFVDSIDKIPDKIADAHFRSQFFTVCDRSGTLLVDFVGKFENLSEDFNKICNKIAFPTNKLPHLMKKEHKNYQEYYSKKTKEIVQKRYNNDIEMFGYEF